MCLCVRLTLNGEYFAKKKFMNSLKNHENKMINKATKKVENVNEYVFCLVYAKHYNRI